MKQLILVALFACLCCVWAQQLSPIPPWVSQDDEAAADVAADEVVRKPTLIKSVANRIQDLNSNMVNHVRNALDDAEIALLTLRNKINEGARIPLNLVRTTLRRVSERIRGILEAIRRNGNGESTRG